METKDSAQLTKMLRAWGQGQDGAEQAIMPLIYPKLERRAKLALQRSVYSGGTIQTRGLVHEAFLKLTNSSFDINDRLHFYARASTILRHILVDYFRSQQAVRRGGGAAHITLGDAPEDEMIGSTEQLLELNELLEQLKQVYPRKARICEMHYFGGLTVSELAELEDISGSTVNKDLRFAYAWMHSRAK